MKHRIFSALFAATFFVTVYSNHSLRSLAFFVILEIIAASIYNSFHVKVQHGYYWSAIRFALLQTSIALLALALPAGFRFIPLALSAVLLYFSQLLISVASEQLLFIETLMSFFGFSLGLFAISFYFAPPSTVILGLIFLFATIAARCGFDPIPRSGREKAFYAFLIGLSVTEITWALLLLPLHFSALGIIDFNAFYVLWMLSYFYFHHNISGKKIIFHVSFAMVLIIITLIATPFK